MLKLVCKIEITGKDNKKISFDYVNEIQVKTSIRNLTDTAVLKVPKKISWREKPLTDFVERNNAITIQAGYENYPFETIFKGYISNVENSYPLVINCENEMHLFKTINVEAQKIEKFDLKAFVEKYARVEVVTTGTVTFGTMDITDDMTLAQALDAIMQKYPYVKGYFQDGKFYAVFGTVPSAGKTPTLFSPERNMISDNLKYTIAEDIKIGIKAVSILRDNTQLEAYAPLQAFNSKADKTGKITRTIKNSYEQRQFFNPNCRTQKELQNFADKLAAEWVTDKMDGTITAFGVPFVRKGDIIMLKDADRAERNGKRFVAEAVDYSFGTSGYRQTITLGNELHFNF